MKKVKLGDVCTVVSGATPSTSSPEYWNGDIVWITPAEITDESYIIYDSVRHLTSEGVKKAGLKPFPAGTVLLSSRAPIGKTAIAGRDMYCNQGFKNLICSQDIYNEYLYFFLSSKTQYLNNLGRGTTFKEISKKIVEDIQIVLPDVYEQKRRAALLVKLMFLIRKTKALLSRLDVLVKARFVEMFGDMASNLKQWDVARIRDVVTDVRYGTSRPAVDNGMYKYLRMNNITYSGELDLTNIKRIDIPENELDKCTVRYGDVLFNRTNSKELVGKTCVYNIDEMMVLAGFIIRIRLDESVLPEFLVAFLNTDFSKKMLFDISKDSIGQANINAQELQNIKIYIPPIMYQQEFVNFKKQVEKTKQVIRQSLEKLETLKKSLMQEYFG